MIIINCMLRKIGGDSSFIPKNTERTILSTSYYSGGACLFSLVIV